jgi:Sigma-70, region 4
MSLSADDKREVCPLHGWVGRRAFQRDRHDLCQTPVEDLPSEDDEYADDDAPRLDEDDEHADDEVDAVDEDEDEDVTEEVEKSPAAKRNEPRWSRAAARRRGIPPKKTLAVRRITQLELAAGRAELAALGADEPYDRPMTRGDCARVPRPCPYVTCKYSLYLDVSDTGSIIINFPHLEPGQMPAKQSCALDLAERGPMTLEDIATVTNLTRERIRQVELKALLRRARPAAIAMGLEPEDAAAIGTRHQVSPGADLEEIGVEGAVPSDAVTLLGGSGGSGGGGGGDSSDD